MKNILMIVAAALTLTSTVQAREDAYTLTLDSHPFDISINSEAIHFRVDYPGLGAKAVCSLELQVAPNAFQTSDVLNKILVVEETFDHEVKDLVLVDPKTAKIDLPLNLYVTQVSISTRDGGTLRQVLKDNGLRIGQLNVVARGCE